MKTQALSKIAITKASDESLDRMLVRYNESAPGGRLTKVELSSWIIPYFEAHCFERCRERIQKDHFDNVTYLESVVDQLRKARKEGRETDIATLLLPLTGQVKSVSSKKKSASDENDDPTPDRLD